MRGSSSVSATRRRRAGTGKVDVRGRRTSAIFSAEQRALIADEDDKTARWGLFDTAVIIVLAWIAYWMHPGTWRRAPAHLRAWLRVTVWWDLVRLVLRNPSYPWKRKRTT